MCDFEDVCVYIHTCCNVLQHKASRRHSKKGERKNSHGGEVYLFSDSTGVSDTTRRSLRTICSWRS